MSKIAQKSGAALAIVGLLATSQVGLASAAGAYTNCAAGSQRLCIYQNSNYGGMNVEFTNTGGANLGTNLTSYSFNDQMSSWVSYRPKYSRWYFDINLGGTGSRGPRCMQPNWAVSQVTSTENDQASSVLLYGDSTRC